MNELLKNTEARMQKSLENLGSEYAAVQAGRANPAILDKITFDYYGTPTPIRQVAAISVTEARTLIIQPWDMSTLNPIEKALQKSDIGVNPQNDGKIIRLIFPQLTEERRKQISKEISKMAENSKISIRSSRHETLDKLKKMKKSGEIAEDEVKNGEKKVQNLTDKFCSKIDELCAQKIKQIMEV